MPIYDQYARIYDDSGQKVFSLRVIPYLDQLLDEYPPVDCSLLDLACGTGTVALAFAARGWTVYGVDGSAGMIEQARLKAEKSRLPVEFSQQDMREFTAPRPVAVITCLYDSLNYMLSLADLRRTFQRVAANLVPGGLFCGDLNTRRALEETWGNKTFYIEEPNMDVILRSSFEPRTQLAGVRVVAFVREDDGRYVRIDEQHTQIAHEPEDVRLALTSSGLDVLAAYDCFTFDPPAAETERIMWVARKK